MSIQATNLKNIQTIDEALTEMGANFSVEQKELFTEENIPAPMAKANLRTDTNKVLGVVGNSYKVIQNNIALSAFDTLVRENKLKFSSGYLIDEGRKLILNADTNNFEVRKGDECTSRIQLVNSHDGSSAFYVAFYVYRQICSNGLWGTQLANKYSVSHTKNAEMRISEALKILNKSEEYFSSFKETSIRLANKILDHTMVEKFLNQIVGEDTNTEGKEIKQRLDTKELIKDLYVSGKGNGQGTGWDLYNAYTEWFDHHRKGDSEQRFKNALYAGASYKEKAFDAAISLL